MLTQVLVASFVVMLASLAGVIFTQGKMKMFIERRLSYFVSFSAGVFLITSAAIGLEVFENVSSIAVGAALILLGYILAWLLQFLLPETHHHHDNGCGEHHATARKIIIGDAIHNITDGIVLVVAFGVSPALGLAATTSIFVHEVLQEISEFFVMRQAGYSVRKALAINFSVSSTILIGVALGYFALASEGLEVLLLAVSSGFFLHVVIHDLLPKRSHHESATTFFKHALIVILGATLMGLVAEMITEPHGHGHDSEVLDTESL